MLPRGWTVTPAVFDGQEQEFLTNAYFFCIGTLAIDTADATNPVLSIKAIQSPGEPGSPSYEASVPLLGPAVLTFDGTVSMFEKHGDNQYFSAQVWYYVGENNNGKSPRYSMGTIWCRIPPTPRWRNFNLPRAGHLVQLQGGIGVSLLAGIKESQTIDENRINNLYESIRFGTRDSYKVTTPISRKRRAMGQPGSETTMIAAAQHKLRQSQDPDVAFTDCYRFGTSTSNQRIEAGSWR
ncbi:hypothetical protein V8E54_014074 [Elaphomyces granulatus]